MNIEELRNNPKCTKIELDYVEFTEVDDMWVRSYTVPKAKTVLSQHVHAHDHITLVSHGTIEAWQDGVLLGQFKAPAVIKIPAGKKHAFTSVTDDVMLCYLHNLRGTGLESPETLTKEVSHANY